MFLGLSTYSFPWSFGVPEFYPTQPFTIADLITYADENKIGYVQIGDNCPLHLLSEDNLRELKDLALSKNMVLQVGTKRLFATNLSDYLAIAKILNSPFVRVVIDDEHYYPEEKEVLTIIQQVLPEFRSSGIQLAIENHDRFSSELLKQIVELTDPHWVGICLDTANSLGAGEGIKEVVKNLAPYTLNVHIKDFSIKRVKHKMGFSISGCCAGSGLLDIPWLIEELNKYKKCETATLEVWSDPETTIEQTIEKEKEWVKKSITYLKTILQ